MNLPEWFQSFLWGATAGIAIFGVLLPICLARRVVGHLGVTPE